MISFAELTKEQIHDEAHLADWNNLIEELVSAKNRGLHSFTEGTRDVKQLKDHMVKMGFEILTATVKHPNSPIIYICTIYDGFFKVVSGRSNNEAVTVCKAFLMAMKTRSEG